jgi:hypothetical protein
MHGGMTLRAMPLQMAESISLVWAKDETKHDNLHVNPDYEL